MNIVNNHYRIQVSYSPELMHLLKQFFASAEHRNEKLKALILQLQNETTPEGCGRVAEYLTTQAEEAEIDIEIVKKLLP